MEITQLEVQLIMLWRQIKKHEQITITKGEKSGMPMILYERKENGIICNQEPKLVEVTVFSLTKS